jgi:hypothetical protein
MRPREEHTECDEPAGKKGSGEPYLLKLLQAARSERWWWAPGVGTHPLKPIEYVREASDEIRHRQQRDGNRGEACQDEPATAQSPILFISERLRGDVRRL